MPFRKPNFFIVGAPKCGTTSLVHWLKQNHQIFLSPIKEPQFFNTDGLRTIKTFEEYEALFKDADNNKIAVGEASTHYLHSKSAVTNILRYNSESKFIVCLRNPVDMAQSLHQERLKQGRETEHDFQKAWYLEEKRSKGYKIPSTIKEDPGRVQYGRFCCLGEQVERLFNTVDKEKVLPVLLEDIQNDPETSYKEILEFLGVDHSSPVSFHVVNEGRQVYWPLLSVMARELGTLKRKMGIDRSLGVAEKMRSFNLKTESRPAISSTLEKEMKKYFEDDVKELSSLIDRDLSHWIK